MYVYLNPILFSFYLHLFHRHIAVFPSKIRILPQFVFNSRDPIVMGVVVEAGQLKQGTPMCVPTKGVSRHFGHLHYAVMFCV